jgi:hypothetical protein
MSLKSSFEKVTNHLKYHYQCSVNPTRTAYPIQQAMEEDGWKFKWNKVAVVYASSYSPPYFPLTVTAPTGKTIDECPDAHRQYYERRREITKHMYNIS